MNGFKVFGGLRTTTLAALCAGTFALASAGCKSDAEATDAPKEGAAAEKGCGEKSCGEKSCGEKAGGEKACGGAK